MEWQYQVLFTENVFCSKNNLLLDVLKQSHLKTYPYKLSVFVDQGVADACLSLMEQINQFVQTHSTVVSLAHSPVLLNGGEASKKVEVIENLYQKMLDAQLDRHSVVVAIGGGAVLDAVGFAASTFHRGVPIIRMPTTVLGQDDAGVGVKNGINAYHNKNLLGSFTPPLAVINDISFLKSLSIRDIRAGLAEAIKVSLIRDKRLFDKIEAENAALLDANNPVLHEVIHRCAELHLNQITMGGDPFESGSSRPLDFGHWSAHQLEILSHYQLRHGEAVAIGIAIDTLYSEKMGFLNQFEARRVLVLLKKLGFSLWIDELKSSFNLTDVMNGLESFRQHLGGKLCITLLEGIGNSKEVDVIDESIMLEILALVSQDSTSKNNDDFCTNCH